MKKLNEIIECEFDIPIEGIKTDSRKVQKGDLFVAIKGFNSDHHLYIGDAINNGAVAVIGTEEQKNLNVCYIKVDDANKVLLDLLAKFYDNIDRKIDFIGITGTDGKTTTATIVSQILDCCYIGTNGVCYKDYRWDTDNTTPEICDLYEILDKLYKLGCNLVVMEVSSEALLHGRVDNLLFKVACLTNIFEDHLNIHKTIENYVWSKKKLFTLVSENGYAVLNRDDKYYEDVKDCCKGEIYSYGISGAVCKIDNINCQKSFTAFDICFLNNRYHIKSKLIGRYNVYNLTLAFVVSYLMGLSFQEIISRIEKVNEISGRGERLEFGQDYTIILDYAHTYNGIYSIVSSFKSFNYRRMIVVTGAAGGREKEKRARIGKMLLEEADYVIFTMDDPRYEVVNDIIDDLVSESKLTNYERVIDRGEAINRAFSIAKEDDLVLILGKGRDNYMAIEDKKVKYCDYDVIRKYFMR